MLNIIVNQETNVKYLIYDQTGEFTPAEEIYIYESVYYNLKQDIIFSETSFQLGIDYRITLWATGMIKMMDITIITYISAICVGIIVGAAVGYSITYIADRLFGWDD